MEIINDGFEEYNGCEPPIAPFHGDTTPDFGYYEGAGIESNQKSLTM